MKKMKENFTDPFAEVRTTPLQTVKDQQASRHWAVQVKADDVYDGDVIVEEGGFTEVAVVSDGYRLIPNTICRNIADDLMNQTEDKLGISWESLAINWNGKHLQLFYKSTDPIIVIENGKGQPLHLGMMVINSYDKTSRFALQFFALNAFCTNQYHNRNLFGYYEMRHNGGKGEADIYDVDDAFNNIAIAGKRLIAIAPRIESLRGEPFTKDLLLEAKRKIAIPEGKWGKVIDKLGNYENNRFGLFQAMTDVTSHEMSGYAAQRSSESVGQYFLDDLQDQHFNSN